MTDEEALSLQKGEKVIFRGETWKVVLSESVRHNWPVVRVKLRRGNDIVYFAPPEYIERKVD